MGLGAVIPSQARFGETRHGMAWQDLAGLAICRMSSVMEGKDRLDELVNELNNLAEWEPVELRFRSRTNKLSPEEKQALEAHVIRLHGLELNADDEPASD